MTIRHLSLAVLFAAAAPAVGQTLAMPPTIIAGAAIPVVVTGLQPQQAVSLLAERVTADGGSSTGYRAEANYLADGPGQIDLASAAPTSGDYSGIDPAGLFWSMHPTKLPDGVAAGTVRVTLRVADRPVATATTRIVSTDPRVHAEPVAGFAGAMLYHLPGTAPLPVVIALGGSEGGSSFGREFGPWLAARGYAVFAMPYYVPDWSNEKLPGLPVDFADIPVDRLAAVRAWIATQPGLDATRIGLYGVSKGGEFAIIAASRFPWLKAVAAVVPSDVVWEGWGPNVSSDDTQSSFAWAGKPLPFVPYRGMRETIAALYRGEQRTLRTPHLAGRTANPERVVAARIPIETYAGALLVAGGGKDETWPSSEMVQNIGASRTKVGRATTVLTFPDAGHGLSGSGWDPQNYPNLAASPAATAHAQIAVQKAALELFATALHPSPDRK